MKAVGNGVLNARHTLRYSWPSLHIVQSVKRKSQGLKILFNLSILSSTYKSHRVCYEAADFLLCSCGNWNSFSA